MHNSNRETMAGAMSESGSEAVLDVQNLNVAASGKPIVKGVSFNVRKREIFCLVGESGSGKSVTASAVMKLLPGKSLRITGGSIRLGATNIVDSSERAMRDIRGNRVTMVFQEPMTALNPLMRVGRQIAEVIEQHNPGIPKPRVRDRVLELLDDVHMPDPEAIINVYPHQLSGGQRQRIVIAMAIALEPELIIADEPTTALDVTTQAQVLGLFRDLQRKHESGILFITHDFDVVREIADRVAVMQHGEIVEMGSADQIFANPQHPYTRALLDAVPHGQPKDTGPGREQPILEVRNVSLTYGNTKGLFGTGRITQAVKNVSFSLYQGETLGLVGESGSGKSSLGRCITTAETISDGQIHFNGVDITRLKGSELVRMRRKVQMIFQDPYRSLNPRQRIRNALIEGPVEAGVPKSRALDRAAELLELVRLPVNALERYPHQFSGGQRQRICIARALAMDPEVVIADEAVSALDVSVQAQVLELFEDLQKRLGFSMLFITHDLRVATQLCNRIAVMKKGEIVELNRADQLLANPVHSYTRALFDAVPGGNWATCHNA